MANIVFHELFLYYLNPNVYFLAKGDPETVQ